MRKKIIKEGKLKIEQFVNNHKKLNIKNAEKIIGVYVGNYLLETCGNVWFVNCYEEFGLLFEYGLELVWNKKRS